MPTADKYNAINSVTLQKQVRKCKHGVTILERSPESPVEITARDVKSVWGLDPAPFLLQI